MAATASAGTTMYSAYPPSKLSEVIFSKRHRMKSPRRQGSQVKQCPPCHPTPTRCPVFQIVTSAPTLSTRPAIVAWDPGIGEPGPEPILDHHVAVADAARVDLDAYLVALRLGNRALDELEVASRLGHLHGLHGCHRISSASLDERKSS